MNQPLVSVVVETITSRFDAAGGALVAEIGKTLDAVKAQSWPAAKMEIIVVLDGEFDAGAAAELERRYRWARFTQAHAANYFAAKNAGAKVAAGELIALLDGDCVPDPDWLERLAGSLTPDVGASAGRTRYAGTSLLARTFSVPDFAHVLDDGARGVSGFNINNVVFRREVFLTHPFDERIARNGGCYFLFHQLRADGIRVAYEPRAVVWHGLDIQGLGFVSKHFERGRDSMTVYRLDDRAVLRSTRMVRKLGALALFPIYARRLLLDWIRITRHRAQIGIGILALPYYFAVVMMTRSIELAGALTALRPRRITTEQRPA
jgi:glycosyltransferase involved in cell wall biosynthesis